MGEYDKGLTGMQNTSAPDAPDCADFAPVSDSVPAPLAKNPAAASMRTIGQSLRAWRTMEGATADELARRVGVSRDTLSRLERGDASVSMGTVLSLCAEFGILQRVESAIDPASSDAGRIALMRGLPKRVRGHVGAAQDWRNNMNWYENSVVYQIYPLGLTGAPWRNDGSDEGATNSDEHRILQLVNNGWVEHIAKLGAACVLLNPVFQSEAHGYDTIDYTQVDTRLGTKEDLQQVVAAFHDAGIRVLFDGVFNHVGRGFWAFQDVLKNREASKYAGWFNINWGGNNEWSDGLSYDCWEGVPYLVKLNHNNFELNEYLANVIRGWEADYDIDGLRLDVAYCLDLGFLGYLRDIANELSAKRGSKFLLLGETMFGDYNRWMNDHACDTVTNYEVYKGLWSSFNSANMHEVAYAFERQSGDKPWDLYTGKHLLDFVDNHDVPRIATKLENKDQLKPLYGLLFGIPGVPSVYYGSEWGIEGEQKPGDHELRPALEEPEWNDLTTWIQELAAARTGSEALMNGDYHELQCNPTSLVFQRQGGGQRVIVAVNASGERTVLHFDAQCGRATDLITGEDHDFGGGSEVEPYSCHFWLCER